VVGVWVFDCSSSHEGLAADTLNVNNMNVNPGGKQKLLRDTIIPLTNPPPKSGELDTCRQAQTMVFALNHPDPALVGKAKGMLAVVKERKSVYNMLLGVVGGEKKVFGKCAQCCKSAAKKDVEWRVALAEMAGQEDSLDDAILDEASAIIEEPQNRWCCLYRVISLQDDFVNEKPEIQHYLEGRGHICTCWRAPLLAHGNYESSLVYFCVLYCIMKDTVGLSQLGRSELLNFSSFLT
jgi:hypothetical protein